MYRYLRMDTIGIAGFSYDFGTLHGQKPHLASALESLTDLPPSILTTALILMSNRFPIIRKLPTSRNKLMKKLSVSMDDISNELLETSRKEKMGMGTTKSVERSVIGLLSSAMLSILSVYLLINFSTSQSTGCRVNTAYDERGGCGHGK